MSRQSSTITWLVGTALAVILSGPVSADDYGTIVLTRDVQPRVATRKEMVPDPNPKVVYGSPDAYLGNGVQGTISGATGGEINDSEFASINTGMAITQRQLIGQTAQPNNLNNQRATSATSGIGGNAGGGNATGGIAGRVTQGVQQGLRPLTQILGQ